MDRQYRGGSLRQQSSSMWRNADNIFSRTSRDDDDEDDEEALKWAALEKLPTYSRLRRGILRGAEGEQTEVAIEALGNGEMATLLERLVGSSQEAHEQFLLKLKNRFDRVGLDLPTIEVRFEHLNVEAEAYVGNRGVPTILNSVVNVLETVGNTLHILPNKKKPISILHDLSGMVKSRRMTLLLGPPGSGKTSLLLALAGKLGSDVKVSGRVTYNGHGLEEFVAERTAAYISQHDLHIGEMTVRETLTFSARCQGVGTRYDMLAELSRREKAANIRPDPDIDVFMKVAAMEGQQESAVTNYILKMLGLEVCADNIVGGEMLRGISGGQKKRVTTGEMLVGPARALFMDEISTGLDSSTTFQIVRALRESIHILGGTALISLLQPAPETYELFDDILLLSDGQVVYQGPREHVLEFFELMGFKCPPRKAVADFLQGVTSRKDQWQYWAREGEPYRFVPMNEFAKAFWDFRVGQELCEELTTPFDKTESHPAALDRSKYGVSKKELLKACIGRELLLMRRNSFFYISRTFQLLLLNLLGMTIFLRTKMHRASIEDATIFMGSLYFSILVLMLTGISEIAMTIGKLPVFYKQRDLMFYPTWVYALPSCIVKIPITIIEIAAWVFVNYYVTGYDPNVGRFFKQYLVLVLTSQMANALFRLIAVLGRNMVVANILGVFVLIIFSTSGGFLLPRDNMKKWTKWLYWWSPIMYAQNAMFVNEFLGNNWNKILPGMTQPLGVLALKSHGIFAEANWYWIGVGALLGYIVIFNGLFIVALTYLNHGNGQAVIFEETLKGKYANLTGELVDISSTKRHDNGHATTRESHGGVVVNSDPRKQGTSLPFVPLSMTFENIRYSVDMPAEMKAQGVSGDRLLLLKGVSGSFRPGVLTALMGVSGAGKTTLMDVLSGRKTGGYIEGSITISGYPKKQETFTRVSGYCEQNDIHSPHITVYESLLYSSWLRLPAKVETKRKKIFIEEVMELVELTPLRGALVGLPGVNGLSIEQRKRLTIAVELVANPSIIFMDEPTSGLDARAATIVMRTVRNAVDTGRTIVCTIHQPNINIFEAFDELFLMKRGGEEIYVGPLGRHSSHLINFFESIRGVNKIKAGYNPATWMLEVTTLAQEDALGISFSDVYKNSELYQRNMALIKEVSTPSPTSKDLYFPTQYSQSFVTQCRTCLWKQHLSYWRNPTYTTMRMFSTILIALMLGTIFWDLGSRRERRQDLFNAMASMYLAIFYAGKQNSQTIQPIVAIERTVFYRERAAGMYSAFPYAFAQVAIELPYVLVQSVAYCLVVYPMIGFHWTAAKFFWYMYFMYFTLLYYTFFGMMTIGLTPNCNIASIIATAFYSTWALISGFLIPLPRIPIWWKWFYWACPMAWTFYGLLVSQYWDIKETIEGIVEEHILRDYFGYRHDYLGLVSGVIIGFNVLFISIFVFSIKILYFQKR